MDWISPETCAGLKTDSPLRGDEIVLSPDAPILARVTEGAIDRGDAARATRRLPRFVVGEDEGPMSPSVSRNGCRARATAGCSQEGRSSSIASRASASGSSYVRLSTAFWRMSVGHVLGLRDVDDPSSCHSFLMSGIVESLPLPRRAASAECGAVSRKWVTSQERDRDSVTAAGQSTEAGGDHGVHTFFDESSGAAAPLFDAPARGPRRRSTELFDRYGERLHALVRLRLGARLRRHLDSRDIVQNTMMKAFQAIDRFRR